MKGGLDVGTINVGLMNSVLVGKRRATSSYATDHFTPLGREK